MQQQAATKREKLGILHQAIQRLEEVSPFRYTPQSKTFMSILNVKCVLAKRLCCTWDDAIWDERTQWLPRTWLQAATRTKSDQDTASLQQTRPLVQVLFRVYNEGLSS